MVLDADGQMDVDALDHLLSPLRKGQAALVRGSRFEPDSGACTVPWLRRQAARSLTPLASQRVGQSIRDPLSGYVALDLNYLPDWLYSATAPDPSCSPSRLRGRKNQGMFLSPLVGRGVASAVTVFTDCSRLGVPSGLPVDSCHR